VTLKLKTADFRIVTRRATPAHPPRSAEELAAAARALLERVGLPAETRYRLAGVGVSNFPDEEADSAQTDLFADPA
jgi:DNA polymerase-4